MTHLLFCRASSLGTVVGTRKDCTWAREGSGIGAPSRVSLWKPLDDICLRLYVEPRSTVLRPRSIANHEAFLFRLGLTVPCFWPGCVFDKADGVIAAANERHAQRAQNSLIKEYPLNQVRDPYVIYSIFVNSATLGSLGEFLGGSPLRSSSYNTHTQKVEASKKGVRTHMTL